MGIENITKKILDEAKINAESILDSANNKGSEIINEANKLADSIAEEALRQADEEATILRSRELSAAELQARKMLLNAKQEAIKKSFEAALDKLKKMPEDSYINYLVQEILKLPEYTGEILLNERDKTNIGEKIIKIVNENSDVNKITLSNETVQTDGGFVLKNGNVEINNTFETILISIKDALTNEVANALFK